MSETFSAADVARWCHGEILSGGEGVLFDGVSIDTRNVREGQLFVAIRGPNHDAHAYLAQAIEAGAAGVMIEAAQRDRTAGISKGSVIAVDDTTRGLGDLATGHRERFTGPVIALTGSSGKTTTKEMCAAVLGTHRSCLKTEGNLNNEYGVPLTLMRREPEHEVAVVEMGMNHRGEIARLAAIAKPTIAVLTNVGTAHIEYLGSKAEIAAEKGDLFAALTPEGTAVANWDDENVAAQSKRCAGRVIRYGRHADADVRATDARFDEAGFFEIELVIPGASGCVRVAGLGETTVINALAAAAAGVACGLDFDEIREGLAAYQPISGRMTRHTLAREITLIDDSYNANPQSMGAALEALASLKGEGRGFAVLGAMGELGANAEQAHRDMGALAARLGIEQLIVVGEKAAPILAGARDAGMGEERIHSCAEHGEAAGLVRDTIAPRDWVLVKGSRAARMERVVELLTNEESD